VNVTYPEINRQYVKYLPEMADDSGREADVENRLFEASQPESRIKE
jgi:hypothetical protein